MKKLSPMHDNVAILLVCASLRMSLYNIENTVTSLPSAPTRPRVSAASLVDDARRRWEAKHASVLASLSERNIAKMMIVADRICASLGATASLEPTLDQFAHKLADIRTRFPDYNPHAQAPIHNSALAKAQRRRRSLLDASAP